MRITAKAALIVATTAALALAPAALAGDLNPPAGPVAPTMKTLDQVEPRVPLTQETAPGDASSVFIISQSGSYYLTENVGVPSGKTGIFIMADSVVLDLSGFTVLGVAGSVNGVETDSSVTHSTLRNGVIASLGANGAIINGAASDLVIRGCAGAGLRTAGESIVTRVTITNCGSGFRGDDFANSYTDCVARENSSDGFRASGVFRGCLSLDNGGNGFATDFVNPSIYTDCLATRNGAGGFDAQAAATYRACRAEANGLTGDVSGDGFLARSDVSMLFVECQSIENFGAGFNLAGSFQIDETATLRDCVAERNTTQGFTSERRAHYTHCVATDNASNGFRLQNIGAGQSSNSAGSILTDCVSQGNDDAQIFLDNADYTVVTGCYVRDVDEGVDPTLTGQIGISLSTGTTGCRIENNTAVGCVAGFFANNSAGNLFIGNRAADNTTSYVLGSNQAGPIQTAATATSPVANIEY